MHTILVSLSVILTLAAVIPYARDILKGKTKPNITSWITWTLLTAVATAAEIAAHEYTTAILTSAAVLETAIIVVLGLRYGYVKYTKFDVFCQTGALSGFVLWYFFNSPAIAVIAAVSIDLLGSLPTVRHSWLNPFEETWITFAMSGLGGLMTVLALSSFNPTNLSYPAYIVGMNVIIAGTILIRRRQ